MGLLVMVAACAPFATPSSAARATTTDFVFMGFSLRSPRFAALDPAGARGSADTGAHRRRRASRSEIAQRENASIPLHAVSCDRCGAGVPRRSAFTCLNQGSPPTAREEQFARGLGRDPG